MFVGSPRSSDEHIVRIKQQLQLQKAACENERQIINELEKEADQSGVPGSEFFLVNSL